MNEVEIKLLIEKHIKKIEDIEKILDFLYVRIKNKLKINISETRLCKESSIEIAKLCDKLNIPYIPFSTKELGMDGLEHYFGITGFNTEFGQICILIDFTYIQFIEDEYAINIKNEKISKYAFSPGIFIRQDNKVNLIKKGYLVLTKENFDDYLRSFIESYKLVNYLDDSLVYSKMHQLFNIYNINLLEKDYLNNYTKR